MSDDRRQFSIGQGMAAVGLLGFAIALVVNPGAARTTSVIAGVVGVLFLAVASMVAVIDLILGVRCPSCGGWTMGRTSILSFRDRYYRCSACAARYRRRLLRGWEDASAREFDPFYARKRPENPWTAPPSLDDEDLVYSKTHVNLLLNKQRRNPDAPDQTRPPS